MSGKRIHRELELLATEGQEVGLDAWLSDPKNPWVVSATVTGPTGSPYAGGTFELTITCGTDYPFHAPSLRFDTPCFHPLVQQENGLVALEFNRVWNPSWNLHSMLLVVQTLFTTRFLPDDDLAAFNLVAAQAYKVDRAGFWQQARHWTEAMAVPVTVRRIRELLGIQQHIEVFEALYNCDMDVVQTVALLSASRSCDADMAEEEQEQPSVVSVQNQLNRVSLVTEEEHRVDTISNEALAKAYAGGTIPGSQEQEKSSFVWVDKPPDESKPSPPLMDDKVAASNQNETLSSLTPVSSTMSFEHIFHEDYPAAP